MRQWVILAEVQVLTQESRSGKENTKTSETKFGNLCILVCSLLVKA